MEGIMILNTRTEGWIDCPVVELSQTLARCRASGLNAERIEVHPFTLLRLRSLSLHGYSVSASTGDPRLFGVPVAGNRDLERSAARIVVQAVTHATEIAA